YTIADQSFKTASRYISAFVDLLDALTGRMEADIVMELLDYDEIATVFAISKQDVAVYQDWVSRVNVRWGKDAKHREQFIQKESKAFTWQYAMERFLMGYAVPENTGIIDDIVPFDCVEGTAAQRLGNFIMFLKTLFSFHTIAGQKHSISEWAARLEQLMSSLLVNNDTVSNDIVFVQSLLQQLVATSATLQITDEIDFIVIKDWINTYLAGQRVSTNFLRKGITFCQLLPMRSIPFQVVCLLGMNDGQFPRIDERLSFDILKNKEKQPRCVRSKRNDDRYLFLESMLSAQKKLFISYEGQSPVDLSLKQPSLVVAELMDYIEQGFQCSDTAQSISNFILTKHHLHRFHNNYFNNDSKKYSYSKLSYHESKAWYGSKHRYHLLVQTPVAVDQMPFHITMDDFISFFKNPARYFIKNVLGISLAENVNDIASDEPFSINGLEHYQLTNELCQRLINGGDSYGYKVLLKKQGKLPDGDLGDIIFEDAQSQVMDFVAKVKSKITCDAEQHELHYTSNNNLVITGNPYLYANQQIYYRYATIKPDDRLHALLWHLFVCATQSDECNDKFTTLLIGKDNDKNKYKELTYQHLLKEKSINDLEQLVSIFLQGQSTILPFFPKTSYVYYNAVTDGTSSKSKNALYKARDAFYGDNGYESIDYDNPYIKRAFYKVDIFDDEKLYNDFDNLSHTIFGIVKDYESEEKESQ
ncbi:MAG TPA: exodeoxyribonuclease V subunit gamma, partial [Spirochaetota bacterium]|nr:exodeoxyribonuclease V subunit gamma [Spirochaetota bacterium]